MNDVVLSGRCLCGALQFDVASDALNCCYCHCQSCRAAAGAPFVVWCSFPIDALSVNSGQLATYKSSARAERGFCSHCGTTVTYFCEDRPDEIDIATTTLNNAHEIVPSRHIWVSEKIPWVRIDDGLPCFERG